MITWLEKLWQLGIPCVFQLATGLYCPGCGGTRAVKALLQGDLLLSFQYHPLILYGVIILLLEMVSYLLSRIFKKPRLHLKHYNLFIYIGIAIIIINWIFKNYMLIVKGADLLP